MAKTSSRPIKRAAPSRQISKSPRPSKNTVRVPLGDDTPFPGPAMLTMKGKDFGQGNVWMEPMQRFTVDARVCVETKHDETYDRASFAVSAEPGDEIVPLSEKLTDWCHAVVCDLGGLPDDACMYELHRAGLVNLKIPIPNKDQWEHCTKNALGELTFAVTGIWRSTNMNGGPGYGVMIKPMSFKLTPRD